MKDKSPSVLTIITLQFLWMLIITLVMKNLVGQSQVSFASGLVVIAFLMPTIVLLTYRKGKNKNLNYPKTHDHLKVALKHIKEGSPKEHEYSMMMITMNTENGEMERSRLELVNHIIKELGIEEELWETQDGRKIRVVDMETNHIQSSMKVIEKIAQKNGHGQDILEKHNMYNQLKKELEKRQEKKA